MTAAVERRPRDRSEDEEAGAYDRQPPQDAAAEQSALGGMLLSRNAIPDVVAVLSGPEDFYRPTHQTIYDAIIGLYERDEPADPVTVAAELQRRGELQRVGGAPYLHTLIATVPTAANAAFYADIVAEKAVLRRLIEAGTRIVQLGYHGEEAGDVGSAVERARTSLDGVATTGRVDVEVYEVDDLASRAVLRYGDAATPGLTTGCSDLDAVLSGGLRPGTLTVIGARPGVGKTAAGIGIAVNAALHGHPAMFFSLEMTEAELTDRIIANLASVRLAHLIRHDLGGSEWDAVERAVDRLNNVPLAVVDNPNLGLATIRSLAHGRNRGAKKLALLVIDYLSLMQPANPRADRHEQVAAMSRGLKLLAKELHVPVIALHQLNRESEKRVGKKPQLSDLRESGAVEADADNVWLLHRPDEPDDPRQGEIDFIVAKNRQGPTTTVTQVWMPQFARVISLSREDQR